MTSPANQEVTPTPQLVCAFTAAPAHAHTPSASLAEASSGLASLHSHDGGSTLHTHGGHSGGLTPIEHGHSHEHLEHAGKFAERDMPDYTGRDWTERAFTVGIGGYVGSGSWANASS